MDARSTLDRKSSVPLHAQLTAVLRRGIETGEQPAGSLLPSEQALQEQFGIARSVVRQSLETLAQEQLIQRERGRGSIVLPSPRYRRTARRAGGLEEQIAAEGGHLTTHVIRLDDEEPPASQRAMLGDGLAWRLERVRSVDDAPLIHMVTWIPQALAPALTSDALGGGSLHEWMRGHGIEPRGGPRQLRAVAASDDTAAHLGVAAGSPVTLLEGITRDQQGRTIEAFMAWHHPRAVFDLDAEVEHTNTTARAQELVEELRSLIAP